MVEFRGKSAVYQYQSRDEKVSPVIRKVNVGAESTGTDYQVELHAQHSPAVEGPASHACAAWCAG